MSIPSSSPDRSPEPMNQCDGCRRGLPIVDGWYHRGGSLFDKFRCTKDRYTPSDADVPTKPSTFEEKLENFEKAARKSTIREQPRGNAILAAARSALVAHVRELDVENAELKKPVMCGVCAGTGKPTSGLPCVCGGAGTEMAEMHGLRVQCFEYERRIASLEAHQFSVDELAELCSVTGHPDPAPIGEGLRAKLVQMWNEASRRRLSSSREGTT